MKKNNNDSDDDDEGYETDAYHDEKDDILLSESDADSVSAMSENQDNDKDEHEKFLIHRANILKNYNNFDMKQDVRLLLNDFNWEEHAF